MNRLFIWWVLALLVGGIFTVLGARKLIVVFQKQNTKVTAQNTAGNKVVIATVSASLPSSHPPADYVHRDFTNEFSSDFL